ncbi:MAG: DUF350 domain-containing protein [Bacteroidetes bacterium]|nr:MAG: DUF350 domain-containing protein [Bacteroidota bacterium]
MELSPAIQTALFNAGFVLLYLLLFFLAKWVKDRLSPYDLDEQLTEYDNVAVSVSVAGYFLAVTAIFVGAVMPGEGAGNRPDPIWWEEYLAVAGYTLGGIVLLQLSRWLNDKLILYRFEVNKEIIKDQNPGTGVVEGGAYLASGLIIGGSVYGEGGGPVSALVFYALGQLCLILFGLLYERISPYSVHDEIERDNTSAGLGFAGALIAIGIIIMRAVSGPFRGWVDDLTTLGLDVLVVFIYLLGVRFVFDKLVLRRSDLQTEIAQDQNLGAGLLEMVVAISFAVVLFFAL